MHLLVGDEVHFGESLAIGNAHVGNFQIGSRKLVNSAEMIAHDSNSLSHS